jgi:precorrin-2 dehydrogenase/sirohydrochlorin ferrochelatase
LTSNSPAYTSAPVYYPVFLNLKGKKAVVIGGGKVAERKILALLKAEAEVTVISPELTGKLVRKKQKGDIRHVSRQYRNGDLRNAFLVIAATDSTSINRRVSEDAPCLVNVVDTPLLCNFIVPSTLSRGPLGIAVSTSGISPALSRNIRKELEGCYNSEFSRYLRALEKIRTKAMKGIRDKKKREEFLKSIVSERMIRILREKGSKRAKRLAEDLFAEALTG